MPPSERQEPPTSLPCKTKSESLVNIINGERNYLFTTQRTLRCFGWGAKEAVELLDTIDEDDEMQLNTICLVQRELTQ
jgi:hypothetical protein